MTEVRVVVPSLLGDVSHLASMCDTATSAGATPLIVANSGTLYRQLSSAGVPCITSGRNEGFTASIFLGAQGDWAWLVILNDDLVFKPEELATCLSPHTLDSYGPDSIVYLDNEQSRTIPARLSVLLSVSLLSNVARKLMLKVREPRVGGENSFRPFSAVAISRLAWDRLGGLDRRYPFAYEDADFIRRAREHGVNISSMSSGIIHLHSQTGGRFITQVLPVATWSGLEYLTKWFGNRSLYRWLLVFALLVRAPIAVATLPQPGKQIRAALNAAKMLITNKPPALPDWGSV